MNLETNVKKAESKVFFTEHEADFFDDARRRSLEKELSSVAVLVGKNRYRFSDGSTLAIDPVGCTVAAWDA